MASPKNNSNPTYGFLTVVDNARFGLFGGYLVLNPAGRPLEFHCTAPIKPNRAQEILYGPTLHDFLYGEQIGGSLIGNGADQPLLVFTDREPALAARLHVSMPMVMVLDDDCGTAALGCAGDISQPKTAVPHSMTYRIDAAHHAGPRPAMFQHGRNRMAVSTAYEADRPLIVERLARLDESFDLSEPFDRIRAAIEEARQAAQ